MKGTMSLHYENMPAPENFEEHLRVPVINRERDSGAHDTPQRIIHSVWMRGIKNLAESVKSSAIPLHTSPESL